MLEWIKDIIGAVCVFLLPVLLIFWYVALGGSY